MTENLKIAAIQMASGPNVDANLMEASQLIETASRQGARVVVLPENFSYMGPSTGDMLDKVERDGDGPVQEFLITQAKKHGIMLVGGTVPLMARDPSKVRAACLVYDGEGKRLARYDKMHLFDVNLIDVDETYQESRFIEHGNEVVVVDAPCGKVGVAVCYDVRFPELFRAMLDKGMEILLLPAAFTALTGKAHWETLIRCRAIENLCYVVAAAQGGYHISGRETYGHSMIVDPWGVVLTSLPRGSGVVIAEADRVRLNNTRRNFPCLEHRTLRCVMP